MMIRALNDMEYMNYALGQPYNIVIALRIKGTIPKNELREAFEKVQIRHPLLKVRIESDTEGKLWLTSENVGHIPIEFQDFLGEENTKEVVLEHLNKSFDLNNEELPLFRVSYMSSTERSDLVLCSQHVISDGLSMAILVRDLVQIISHPEEEIEVLDAPIIDKDIFPPKIRKMLPKTALRARFVLNFFKFIRFVRYISGRGSKEIIAPSGYEEDDLQLISWSLSENQTETFLKICKQHKVTVHCAICSAFLPHITVINNPVNLRGRLNLEVGESFGLFAGGSVIKMRYRNSQSYWKNAMRYQRKLLWNLRDKKVFGIHKTVHNNVPLSLMEELGPVLIDVIGRQEAFAVTNLGSLDRMGLILDSDRFTIESFYGALSFAVGAIIVLVYTMRNRMHFQFHYLKSRHDEKRMHLIAEDAQKTILRVIEEL
ncbi:MAG: condensation domain-containing protein [Candidatus Heimdallarchaeaceae archaeon]